MRKREFQRRLTQWREFLSGQKLTEEERACALGYVERLMSRDLPPIFDFSHLCYILGVSNEELAALIFSPQSFYRTFTIPKRSGGQREITAPYPSMKSVQRWILSNILSKVKPHGCSHGFIPRRSIVTNVKVHVGQPMLLKIDLKDFFPSITLNWVINVFKQLGYENTVAFFLAAICCQGNRLPQGSPASPAISNIICRHMDRRLYRLAKSLNLNYTRYADDIGISGSEINPSIIRYFFEVITDCGFQINEKKVRLYSEGSNKILTGISLNGDRPRITREYRRHLTKEIHYINKYGLTGHLAHIRNRKANYLESLLGKLNFWLMVEPENLPVRDIRDRLSDYYKRQISPQE